MANEPGRYESLCLYVLEKSKGKAAIVIVVNGSKGTGLSIKEDFSLMGGAYHIKRLPKTLRRIADEVERANGAEYSS